MLSPEEIQQAIALGSSVTWRAGGMPFTGTILSIRSLGIQTEGWSGKESFVGLVQPGDLSFAQDASTAPP